MSKPLTIGDVARETGVPPATLRAWEARHGFPQPHRLAGGRRGYTPDDVTAVRRVIAERASGSTLAGAIERALGRVHDRDASVFAALPISGNVVSKYAMEIMSHALEDELAARAEAGVLVGLFQEQRFYDAAAERWDQLARQSAECAVFADFTEPTAADGRPSQVPLPTRSQLAREWGIVHVAEHSSALLVGRERLDRVAGERSFEVVWTVDPSHAREAMSIAVRAAAESAPIVSDALELALDRVPSASGPHAGFVGAVMTRAVAYFDESRPD